MKKANLIILAGQSNAVGVGYTSYLPKHFSAETVEKYHTGWEKIQIHYYSHNQKNDCFTPVKTGQACAGGTTFGPEVGMAEYLSEVYPDEEFFIVKCAFGCMSMHRDFCSPSGNAPYDKDAYADQYPDILAAHGQGAEIRPGWCYNELVKITRDSIAMLEEAGYTPEIREFCWMQGEADGEDMAHVTNYGGLYDSMLADFTDTFRAYMPDCTFADAAIGPRWQYHKELNAIKAAYAAAHPNHTFIDTIAAGLTTENEPTSEPDTAHYDADSVIRLGHLFAECIK